ncbi:uncharacterized protein LOC124277674 [Haliotis rubra]|uniref:uncharacterized protein LOC124277674 n=1 Tax=Haliotis rubra TaxID=36100 RepID=UPI001EE5E5C3|nr:uncharacterized protein LOC124277674 [Haliotis rubra]
MTMFDSRLFLVLLAVLVPSLGSVPGPNELPDKLQELLDLLVVAKADFQCIFDIIDEQCPCLTPGDPGCFETSVLDINSTLCDLISDLNDLIEDQPDDCPALEGCAALVAGCNSSDIAVVDPVGTILPSIVTNGNVSALTVTGADTSVYVILYTTNNPLILHRLRLPAGRQRDLVIPLDGEATGLGFCAPRVFIAMEDSEGNNVIYCFNRRHGEIIVNISCAGKVRVYNGRVYFSDCNEILCVNRRGGDLETKVKFPMNIKSFDIIDNDTIVFCDVAGGLWTYNLDTECFKLLDCNVDEPCCDVKINRCSWLIYVAYPDNPVLDIFNHTTCEEEGTLNYTTSTPKECPRLEFKPPCV